MEMKKESNILTEEKPKYIISLKKRYRILYIVMFGMMPVTASDKQTYQEKFAPEIAVRTSMADFKKEDKLVDLPLYAIEQIAEL